MILKFVLYPTEKGDKAIQEVFIECSGFNQSYVDNGEPKQGEEYVYAAHFAITGNIDNSSMEVECENTAVYVMNDQGKTIDSYRWRKAEDGKIARL